MVGGCVEGVEAVVLGLDLRAVGDGETDLAQDAAHLLAHERERVIRAGAGVGGRQRGIDGGAKLGLQFRRLDGAEGGVEERLQRGLRLVDELAHGGPLVLRHGAHLLHQRGELAVGADEAGLGGLELGARFQRGEIGLRLGDEGGQGGLHGR